MILPIYAYGQPVLKRKAADIDPDYPELQTLVANMWETMYQADGVGLAAPQIGLSIRLFVVDSTGVERKEKTGQGIKQVFINAQILEEWGEPCSMEEGCLSIPKIHGEVERPSSLRIRWMDEHFQEREAEFGGFDARVIQHEYDHIEGKLFVEKLKPLKKRMIQRRLQDIAEGRVSANYRMKFAVNRASI
ncbi:MAG: peptide deformylase [Saprospiraceae bacterium]